MLFYYYHITLYVYYCFVLFLAILMESAAFDYLDAPLERITGADVPMPYSLPLEKKALPNNADITAAIKRTVARKL